MLITFFIYILFGTIILFSKNKSLSILSCIAFGVYILVSRDILAAPDTKHYINFFKKDILELGSSKTFLGYKFILDNILMLPGMISYHLSTIILFGLITFISIKSKIIYPIFFFLSSEAFSVLSFNGIRQGIATAALILIFYLYKRLPNNKKVINPFRLITFALSLLIAATLHSTVFGYLLLILFFYFLSYFINIIFYLFRTFKVKKNSVLIVSLITISISLLVSLVGLVGPNIILKGMFNLTNNTTYNSGTVGSFYRLVVMIILVSYPYLRIHQYKIKLSFKDLRSNKLVFFSTISILSLIPFAFFGAQLFVRLSYFYIVPIIFNFLYWQQRKPGFIETSTLTNIFIIFVGLVTYSSYAIENILYT